VGQGVVLASDSRTNAGVDQVSTYSKMHRLLATDDATVTLVSAGNLATTQAVVRRVTRDLEQNAETNLARFRHLSDAVEYIGKLNVAERTKHATDGKSGFSPDATFIVGGQIRGEKPEIFLVYPEGNYIRAARRAPYLQIGELKYGKPILDRIISEDLPLHDAIKCALVSLDSTMRSNAAVGPPIELQMIEPDRFGAGVHVLIEEGDDYLDEMRLAWQESLKSAFEALPPLPGTGEPRRQS
jgi:putative proteasome-type protease